MNSVKKIGFTLLVVIAATLTASAQESRAKFTLTHAVRWDNMVVPAGSYRISVESGSVPRAIVSSVDLKGPSFIVVPTIADYASSCSSSSVSLTRDGSAWNVNSVCFSPSGLALYFGVAAPKTTLASLSTQVGSETGSH